MLHGAQVAQQRGQAQIAMRTPANTSPRHPKWSRPPELWANRITCPRGCYPLPSQPDLFHTA